MMGTSILCQSGAGHGGLVFARTTGNKLSGVLAD